ncbi:Gfo/Idh/MocA family oxidoreductase [Paenibacillus sp. alder61]|uniref:Gfo/Idh/MocA family protein n=1 Tax=Paenibacillus sp. alder61 TaxID=2862948 RepID=UPI001CD529A9|nr:Gfo/Idh/MocA family oxidoreductase [Paenibacillus sp. alder61]MCA1293366.1 Gfo/Idh/MocA family oxidoreductase [Paenibacillus sp. alder61]
MRKRPEFESERERMQAGEIRFAIVGCGHIAGKHLEAIQQAEGAALAALCDPNLTRVSALAESWNVPAYAGMAEMLAREPDIDAVCICTPSGLHAELAIAAARAGKHLVIEKPLALCAEEAESIGEAAAAAGVKATVVHPNRYRPAIRHLKEALDRKMFGKLSHVNATVRWNRSQAYYDQAAWRGTVAMDGGVLMNQGIHSLDLLLWLFGPVAEVRSWVDTRIRNMEAEDTAIAALKFANGTLGVVEACTTVYEHNLEESLAVFGENGYVLIGGRTANWIKAWNCVKMPDEEIGRIMAEVEADPYGVPGHERIIADMVEAIRTGREPAVTLEEGARAVRLAWDIVRNGR